MILNTIYIFYNLMMMMSVKTGIREDARSQCFLFNDDHDEDEDDVNLIVIKFL